MNMTDQPKELLPCPCPFCGGTKITVEWEPQPSRWFAECAQCSCQGPFCQTEPKVIAAWNTRASDLTPSARIVAQNEEMNRLRALNDELTKSVDDAAAFPTSQYGPMGGGPHIKGGMTLRDWFAGMALSHYAMECQERMGAVDVASQCYWIADAMIAERSKQ